MAQRAELEITIRGNQAVQEANKIKRGITDIGTKGQTTASQIDGSVNKITNSLNRVGTSSKTASTSITELGTKSQVTAAQITSATGRLATVMSRTGVVSKTAAAVTTIGMVRTASAINLVGGSANVASANITKIGTAAQVSASRTGSSMKNVTRSLGVVGTSAQRSSLGFGAGALGIAALGTSASTTFTGMSALNKAQLKVNKSQQNIDKAVVGLARAEDLLASTTLAITRFQSSVNKLQKEGKENTDAYRIAVMNLELQQQKLVTAQDDLKIKTSDVKIRMDDAAQAADDLQDTYINMSVSIANTILISLFTLSTILQRGSAAVAAMPLAGLRASTSSVIVFKMSRLTKSMVGFTGGARLSRVALSGLSKGIRVFFIALGPIGFAIIGVGLAMTAWETNAFGFRDGLIELWNWMKKIMPVLMVLESLVSTAFSETTSELEKTTMAAKIAGESLESAGNAARNAAEINLSVMGGLESESKFNDSLSGLTQTIDEHGSILEDFSTSDDGAKQLAEMHRKQVEAQTKGLDNITKAFRGFGR